MMKNVLTITIRNIVRDKYYTFINITGLAIGLASAILIFLYVQDQLSYDDFHPDVDRLYRINQTNIWDPNGGIMSSTVIPLAQKLKEDYPEIESTLRINTPGGKLVRYEYEGQLKSFYESNVLAVDSNFFSFFGFKLGEGDPHTALAGVNKVVISDEVATKFFGSPSAAPGKILLFGDEKIAVEVTGVAQKQPDNAHFHFDYLLSMQTNPHIKRFEWNWIWTQIVTYVKLKPDADVGLLQSKMGVLAEKYVKPMFNKFNMNYTDFVKDERGWRFYLQPVRRIYLYSTEEGNRIGPVSDINYVLIFSGVGIFVMLLAIINFINLSTARATRRAKEVGIKKTLGAERYSLIFQFQFESLLLTGGATIIGLGVTEFMRLIIVHIVGVKLPFLFSSVHFFWFVPTIVIVVALLSGIYPSFYLTAFRPASVLKGKVSQGMKNIVFRNVLVSAQFVISVSFIIATIVVFKQLNYFKEKDMGFDKDHILVINHAEGLGNHLQTFRDEISKLPGVATASVSFSVPGRGSYEDIFYKEGDETKYPLSQFKIDHHYFETLDLMLVAGRGFVENVQADQNSIILNETAVEMLGWTLQEALEKKIIYPGDEVEKQEVIGVVKDFNFQSLNTTIAPLIFFNINSNIWGADRVVSIKFSSVSVMNLVNELESEWKKLAGNVPFEYSFLDQEWANKYQEEEKLGSLFALFTGLSITIAMIGLIGLVTYSAEQRKKEIGIRKVFGASVSKMVLMLNSSFTKLMVSSFLVAMPVSWVLLNKWLQSFPYRITIDWIPFFISAIIMILITWLTVSYQSFKAALTNPADVLKEE